MLSHSDFPAYQLADRGYDVWLGNIRAAPMSEKHLKYTQLEADYWAWSWDEIAEHDIAAFLRYVAKLTQQRGKIIFIGHSMGTTLYFALLSSKPEFNEYIKAGFALAPVVYLSNVKGLTFDAIQLVGRIPISARLANFNVFPSPAKIATKGICHTSNLTEHLCQALLETFYGPDEIEFDSNIMNTITARYPVASSLRSIIQFSQQGVAHRFQHYDYGLLGNLRRYRQINPLSYPLKKISTPVYLYYGPGDYIANPTDVNLLASELPNLKVNYRIPYDLFSHADFFWSIHVQELLYDKFLADIEQASLI